MRISDKLIEEKINYFFGLAVNATNPYEQRKNMKKMLLWKSKRSPATVKRLEQDALLRAGSGS